tara:strand:- start:432 stop:671 length:240 start_codon:yes stop_codon:yes gene_type:complete
MRIAAHIFAMMTFVMLVFGIMFKVQHWPGAQIMMVFGYMLTIPTGIFILIHKLIENKKKSSDSPKEGKEGVSNESILDA